VAVIELAARPRPAEAGPRALWSASWWVVRRPALLVPAALALVLVLATAPVLGDGYGLRVLRGAGVLLACAWVTTTDDPSGEVLAGSPYPRAVRSAARFLAGGAVVGAAWLVAAAVVQWRAPDVPVLGLGLEFLALAAVGLGLGAGLRAWRDQQHPAYTAVVGLAVLAFLSSALPRWYALQQTQTWGPPWEAAQIRWAAVLLVAVGVLGLALRDPLVRPRRT
jgi:hypothetical protein